jgi:hypothetical protein
MIVAPPPAGLTVSPARVELAAAGGAAVVQVRNPAGDSVVVDVASAAYALDLGGRPRLVAARGGVSLVVRPRTLALPARTTRTVVVAARAVPGTRPGDHPELLVLATRPAAAGGGVGVRLRVGVPVVVRVTGTVVHRLAVDRVRLAGRIVRVELRNGGNVIERVAPSVALVRRRRVLVRLAAATREILPGARAMLRLVCPPRLHGPARVVVRLPGRPARSWQIRLR